MVRVSVASKLVLSVSKGDRHRMRIWAGDPFRRVQPCPSDEDGTVPTAIQVRGRGRQVPSFHPAKALILHLQEMEAVFRHEVRPPKLREISLLNQRIDSID